MDERAEAAGLYNAALKITTAISFSLVAVSGVVNPHFAGAASAGDSRLAWRIFRRGAVVASAIAGPVAAAILVAPVEYFSALFGSGLWLHRRTVADPGRESLLHAVLGLGGFLLVMAGGENEMQRWVVWAAALNVVGNVTLIPVMGAYGAATATAASTIVMDVSTTLAAFKVLRARSKA